MFLTNIDSLSKGLVVERIQLAHAALEGKLDTTRVNIHLNNISQLQLSAQRAVISHLLSVKNILNPDQQKKFFTIILERFSTQSNQPMPGLPSQ
jgi:hypothetical protein